jgi:phosphoglycerol transferase MdoB-like AlkP superfamily enzyme
MRERLNVLGRLAIYWIAFMIVARISFLVYNHDQASNLNWIEILKVMLYGLKMDASMSGYLLMLSGIMLTLSVFIKGRWIFYTLTGFTLLFLLFSCITITADLELYRHWGFRINTTPFFYMGSEAAGSVSIFVILKLIVIIIVLFGAFTILYFKFIANRIREFKSPEKKTSLVLLIVSALMFIPIRGSFRVSTMNVGHVYFHKTNNFANHSGINAVWHFLNSLQKDSNIFYPEDYFDKQLTEEYFQKLYPKSDSTAMLLTSKRPNVILIIIESYTANVIEALGGEKEITPNINALAKEGILFTNFYASGDRTDKGLVSVLSGYPAQTQRSIIKYPGKTQKLSYISRKLENIGYKTSFVYGGDADFANFRSFLTYNGFGHITSDEDFPSELDNSKWGVHDQYLFDQATKELDTTSTEKPFFKVILTLSSHEPFDVPLKQITGNDEPSLFLNSCYYTDKYLGEFVAYCKKQPWWNNTLIVITADHGHRLPKNIEPRIKERFRIPLLWIGGTVKKDTIINTIGGQTDIANTLLGQIDEPSPDFIFSKNMLGSNVKNFAIYIFNDGYGYVDREKYIIHDNPGKLYLKEDGVNTEEDKYFAKAYLQKLYSDYNSKK